jgi:hypothetical protein
VAESASKKPKTRKGKTPKPTKEKPPKPTKEKSRKVIFLIAISKYKIEWSFGLSIIHPFKHTICLRL